jgi:glycosyltransferase involved in cell wall biosynthesis
MSPTLFLDTSCVTATSSGTARYTRALGTALARCGDIVTTEGNWHPLGRMTGVNDKITTANSEGNWHPLDGSSNLPQKPDYHRELNIRLLANRPDIRVDAAVFPNYFMPPGWPYPSAVTIHDVSFVSHPHFYSLRMRAFYKARIRHTLKYARIILTVSEQSKRQITRWLGVKPDRILVHPPSPPFTLSQSIPIHREPYLLYIGNLEPKKNIRRMLEAFALLRQQRPDVSLVLTGRLHGSPTWNREILQRMASIPGVTYAGYVPEQQMHDYLAYASALVLVSHVEGFGLPVMDALANDIPVLISRDAALGEVAGLNDDGVGTRSCKTGTFKRTRDISPDLWSDSGIDLSGGHDMSGSAGGIGSTQRDVRVERVDADGSSGLPGSTGRVVVADQNDVQSIRYGMMEVLERNRTDMSGSRQEMLQRFGEEACYRAAVEITERLTPASRLFFFNDPSGRQPSVKSATLKSVAYADVFNSGISRSKLYLSLLGCRTSQGEFNLAVDDLLQPPSAPLVEQGNIISLKKHDFIGRGRAMESAGASVRHRHTSLLRRVAALPWVKGLYFSGGTVHGSGLDEKPDLDLLVVSSSNRVWLTYFTIRMMALLTGRGKSLCTNYLVDESAMEIHWQRDDYTAFQLLFLRKVVLKKGARHLRAANRWVYGRFPNSPTFTGVPDDRSTESVRRLESGNQNSPRNLFASVLNGLNILVMMVWGGVWNKAGLRSGTGGLLWDAHRIKLHTHDHRPFVKEAFQQRLRSLLPGPANTAKKTRVSLQHVLHKASHRRSTML